MSRDIRAYIQHVTFLMRKTTTKWKPQKRKLKSPAVSFFTRGSMKRLLHVRRLRPLTISQSDEVEFVQQPWMATAAERKERRVMQVCLLKCVWKLCIKMRCSCWSQVSVPFRQEELFKKHLRIFFSFRFRGQPRRNLIRFGKCAFKSLNIGSIKWALLAAIKTIEDALAISSM